MRNKNRGGGRDRGRRSSVLRNYYILLGSKLHIERIQECQAADSGQRTADRELEELGISKGGRRGTKYGVREQRNNNELKHRPARKSVRVVSSSKDVPRRQCQMKYACDPLS
jgi:hypothetical protein